MTLKARLKSLDEAPEAVRSLYVEQNGEFVLPIEGMVSKDRLDEFRTNNVELKRQIDELTAKFEGIDPDEYRTLSDKAERERTKKLIDAGKVDEIVNERVGAAKAGFDKERETLSQTNATLNKQLEGLLIDNAVRDAAAKSGVRPTAVDDVLLRSRQVFKVLDGVAVAFDGEKQLYGNTGDPLTVPEYISGKLAESAPHLFEPSQGSGSRQAQGDRGGSRAGVINRGDSKAFLNSVDDIASGKLKVA